MAEREDGPGPTIPAGRVAQLWNWLPAFRVVAETENLREAAELLHVTPSALSRTIKLLEENLELTLFERHGRSLKLNDRGRQLLWRTRQAMRGIDEGLRDLFGDRFRGRFRVSSAGITAEFVLPALAALRRAHPELEPAHHAMGVSEAISALSTGKIDVAFHESPVTTEELSLELLAEVENAVFCGPGHPLYDVVDPSLEQVTDLPFVAPPRLEGQGPLDDWPPTVPRRVGLTVESWQHGRAVCASGDLLAVLPAAVASSELKRLPGPDLGSTALYALRRPAQDTAGPVDELLRILRTSLSVQENSKDTQES